MDLIDFISGDMQEYMLEKELSFTDFEKATLIYNSNLPVKERYDRLGKLSQSTKDERLKKQIAKELEIYNQDMSAFDTNRGGYVYAVKSYEFPDDPFIDGYFASAQRAYNYAVRKNYRFDIEKHRINGFEKDGAKPRKAKLYTNPYLFKNEKTDTDEGFSLPENYEDCVEELDYIDIPVASAHYSEKGELNEFSSAEIERDDADELEHCFSPELFKNAFIYMPNPFERGDIVRTIADRDAHGFIAESREAVEKYHKMVREGRFEEVDFIDSGMTVDFIEDNGSICHSHINPAFLERYEPDKTDDDYQLLTAGRALLKGETTLDWFLTCYEEFKKKVQSNN
jgi:hypothetical protein